MSGNPHQKTPERAALLDALRGASEVSGNLMIYARGSTCVLAFTRALVREGDFYVQVENAPLEITGHCPLLRSNPTTDRTRTKQRVGEFPSRAGESTQDEDVVIIGPAGHVFLRDLIPPRSRYVPGRDSSHRRNET